METDEAEALVAQALRDAHLDIPSERPANDADLAIDVNGKVVRFEVKAYSLVDLPRATMLAQRLSRHTARKRGESTVLLVVADRIVEGAREVLRQHRISWLDARGHLFINAPELRIDMPTSGLSAQSSTRTNPLSGRVGLAVAVDILLNQALPVAIRETARRVGAAPSSVSTVVSSLISDGLLNGVGSTDFSPLFWATAAAWRPTRVSVARYPHPDPPMQNPALELGLDDVTSSGWALSGDIAASHLGAPIGVRSDAAPDLYLPTRGALRLARSILGEVQDRLAGKATLALAPVAAVCTQRIDATGWANEVWPLARPLFVALDLAQDPGRGQEILTSWTPEPVGSRVW